MRRPVHPGEVLREEFMLPLDLSAEALAERLGVSVGEVRDLAAEKVGVTETMAQRLAQALGTSAQFWLNLQAAHDAGAPS